MISFFLLIFSQSVFNYESGTYPYKWKSYVLQLFGWIVIIGVSKMIITSVFAFTLYFEVKAFIELSLYPFRNIRWLHIAFLDIIVPFIVSSISNAMCDHFL